MVRTEDISMLAQSGVTLYLLGSFGSNSGKAYAGVSLPLGPPGVFLPPLAAAGVPLPLAIWLPAALASLESCLESTSSKPEFYPLNSWKSVTSFMRLRPPLANTAFKLMLTFGKSFESFFLSSLCPAKSKMENASSM